MDYLSIILKSANICVFEVDLVKQLYISFMNSEDIFHVSGDSILKDVQAFSHLSPQDYQKACSAYFSHPDDDEVIAQAFRSVLNGQPTSYQARMKAGNSDFVWCKIDVTPIMENEKPIRMIGVITNINHMIDKVKKLEAESHLDNFTKLYNKNYTLSLIKETLLKYPFQKHALLLLDIDRFKNINDTYGHAYGDDIILLLCHKLKSEVRNDDIVGRFGGDEFIILLKDIQNIDFLHSKLPQLIHYNNNHSHCSTSIGVAIYPDDASQISQLFECADQALYHAKQARETYTLYSQIDKNT